MFPTAFRVGIQDGGTCSASSPEAPPMIASEWNNCHDLQVHPENVLTEDLWHQMLWSTVGSRGPLQTLHTNTRSQCLQWVTPSYKPSPSKSISLKIFSTTSSERRRMPWNILPPCQSQRDNHPNNLRQWTHQPPNDKLIDLRDFQKVNGSHVQRFKQLLPLRKPSNTLIPTQKPRHFTSPGLWFGSSTGTC